MQNTCDDRMTSGAANEFKELGVVTFTCSNNSTISEYTNVHVKNELQYYIDTDISKRNYSDLPCHADKGNDNINVTHALQLNSTSDGCSSQFTLTKSETSGHIDVTDDSCLGAVHCGLNDMICVKGNVHNNSSDSHLHGNMCVVKSEQQQELYVSNSALAIADILQKSQFDRYIESALAIQHGTLIRCLAQQISCQAILDMQHLSSGQVTGQILVNSAGDRNYFSDNTQESDICIIITPTSVKLQPLRVLDLQCLCQPKVMLSTLRCSTLRDILRQPQVCLGKKLDDILKDEVTGISASKPKIICVEYDDKLKCLSRLMTDLSSTTQKLLAGMYQGATWEKKHQCLQCGHLYLTRKTLYGHVQLKHTAEFKFECATCSKKFLNKHHYCTHVRHHLKILHFQCDICKWKFVCKPLLIHHLLAEHDKKYQCPHCTNEYSMSKALRTHLRGLDNRYKCPKCGKILGTFNSLKRHVDTIH